MSHIVVIPIYLPSLSEWERKSFMQCCKVLQKHPICLVTYKELDCTIYYDIARIFGVNLLRENFDKNTFSCIQGYNALMMSSVFYERFALYDYMLIYQLDAYLFNDLLDDWCKKGYDYIGAPWFYNFESHEEHGYDLWKVGNGGFSLRRITTHIKVLNHRGPVVTNVKMLYHKIKNEAIWKRPLLLLALLFGWHNTIEFYIQNYMNNEDFWWSDEVPRQLHCRFSIPTPQEAMKFAFELSPTYLFDLNGHKIPFGCHGWHKYEYDTFWKNYIE